MNFAKRKGGTPVKGRANRHYRKVKPNGDKADVESLPVTFYSGRKQYDKVIEQHELELETAKQSEDKAGERRAYSNLGNCYSALGQFQKAIKQHELELETAKQTEDKAGERRAYSNLGNCYSALGQFQKAIKQHEIELRIAKQIADKAGEGLAYENLGICYREIGQFQKSKELHEIELRIAKEIGDKAAKGSAYGNLGNSEHDLGNYDKAENLHKLNLNIAKQIGDKGAEGRAHGNLGTCYGTRGQYDKALEQFELHLKIADVAEEGTIYGNLGNCYFHLGEYVEAKEQHEMHLSISKLIGDKAGQGRAYGNIGNCYFKLKQYDEAKKAHKLHLNVVKEIGDKAGEGCAYGNLGSLYHCLGKCDEAKKCHELQLNAAVQIGHKVGEGIARGNLGICLGQHSNHSAEQFKLALKTAQQMGDQGIEETNYHNLGVHYYVSKQYEKAERELRNSVRCFQTMFRNVPRKDRFKISFQENFSTTLDLLIEVLLIQGKTDDALVCAEERRSKALGELMQRQHHHQGTEHNNYNVLELSEILEIVKEIGSTVLFYKLLDPDVCIWVIKPNGYIEFHRQRIKAPGSSDLNSLINYARALLVELPSVGECEDRSLSFLYSEIEDNPKSTPSVATVVNVRGEVHSREAQSTQVSQQRVREDPKKRNAAESGADMAPVPAKNPLAKLYQLLLAPVRQSIDGSQLVIVPDGPIPLVPFAALQDEDGSYISDSFHVRLVPSLVAADMIRRYPQVPDSQTSPLIVGDPYVGKVNKKPVERLPHAEEEVQMIGRLLTVTPLTAERATREAVLAKLESANLIHIAAHGDAERGEILLAPSPGMDKENLKKDDVLLTMCDLEGKHLRAQLVVLSCCYSAHGHVKSEGVIGIARAFLGAGARAVLVATQAIDDRSTFMFMEELYKDLVKGRKASEALGRAMKAARNFKDSRLSYWAPFVLVGEDVTPLPVL